MVCYSRRTYSLPGDAERRSPAPSAAVPGVGRLPSDTPSRYATGGRLTMRAGDAAILHPASNFDPYDIVAVFVFVVVVVAL